MNMDGERDVLGLWLGPTGGEGAEQWMSMPVIVPQYFFEAYGRLLRTR